MEQLLTNLSQPVVSTLFVAVVTVFLSYLAGRRKTVHDRLYEERAKVVASLFKHFQDVKQRFASLVSPIDYGGEPDKDEKAKLAAESFDEFQTYYRHNYIWLSRGVSGRVENFMNKYRQTFLDFDHEDLAKWNEVWKRFEKESPEITVRLEIEFRAALGHRGARLHRFWLDIRPRLSRLVRQ